MDQDVRHGKKPSDKLGRKGHFEAIMVEVAEEDGFRGGGDFLEDV